MVQAYTADGRESWYSREGTPAPLTSTGVELSSDQPEADFSLTVFPNPAVDGITVIVKATEPGDITVELIDLLGRSVTAPIRKLVLDSEALKIPVGHLPAGVYLTRVTSKNGVQTLPLTVAH